MSDRPCHICREFIYSGSDTPGKSTCHAIEDGLATRLDLPSDPHNPYVGVDQIRCVAQRLRPDANGNSVFFNQPLVRATALIDFARLFDAFRIADSHNGKL